MKLFRQLIFSLRLADLAVLALYVVGGRMGLSLAFRHGSISPIWPPSGIALAALILLGVSRWPVIFCGAFLSNAIFTTVGPWVSLGIAIGNTLEAACGAALLRRWMPRGDYFVRWESAAFFFFLAGAVGPMVSATIGTFTLHLGGLLRWADFPVLWFTWWVGDAGGIVMVVPWVLSLGAAARWGGRLAEVVEVLGLLATSLLLCELSFGSFGLPLAFLLILVFIWAAIRFPRWIGSTLVILVSLFAIRRTLEGTGQFSGGDFNRSLLVLQIFVIASGVTIQLLAALIQERKEYVARLVRGEKALQESEARFRQLAENIREVFYISSVAKPEFLYLSPAFETVWQRKRGDVYRNPSYFLESIHPDDKNLVLSSMAKQQGGEPCSIEYRILLPDGNVNWIWDRAFPVRDGEGQVFRIAGIAEDITLRKEVDAELSRKAEDLARANRELEHFASIASHDLKAPLRTVSSFVRLLKKSYHGKLDARADEFIDFAVDGCKRMDQLIDDLLLNARIGGKQMELQPLKLEEVVRNTLNDLASQIKESAARVTLQDLPQVLADPVQIREVFQNLISNAIKYRRDDPPRILISAKRQDKGWLISVKDNGIGIAESALHRIFASFVRLSTYGPIEGSGIGLATCKKVIEQRGGKIWAESVEGQGSTFAFTIPDTAVSAEIRDARGPVGVAKSPVVKERPLVFEILMVEDSPADSNVIEILLKKERFPFRIHIAKDGEEALGVLKRIGTPGSIPIPSLILLDLNLPRLDGMTVLREIKADPRLKSIPVIVLTSSVREEDVRKAYELSASCYMRKPRDLNGYREMLTLLRKFWFEQAQLPNLTGAPTPDPDLHP